MAADKVSKDDGILNLNEKTCVRTEDMF